METRVQTRTKRKRKVRKGRVFFALLFLAFLFGSIFFAVQYFIGTQLAGDTEPLELTFDQEFTGVPSQDGKMNILLMGIDSREGEQSRSDTMMVVQWDGNTDEIKVVSLMRDIYAEIPGYQNYKLNTAFYLGGPELVRQTVQQNFGIDVEHYVLLDFQAFENMVDAVAPNGVEMDVEQAMSENIGVSLEPGVQQLNGKELLGYARFRADSEGDFGRVQRQQKVIQALKDEAISFSGVFNAPRVFGAVQPYMQTSMSKADQAALLARIAVSGGGELDRLTIPVEGGYSDGYFEGVGSVLIVDETMTKEAVDAFLNE